ncbi:hypothetical protein CHARACLAT_001158 [Characodon lateralis]|uniref:Uncharacterized protein n=1 Tax=Characodon lateralis TaxID=208331 RepID=A0ABU7DFL8_9TELE|nr:hypothetical protein [Characodon lateralis]
MASAIDLASDGREESQVPPEGPQTTQIYYGRGGETRLVLGPTAPGQSRDRAVGPGRDEAARSRMDVVQKGKKQHQKLVVISTTTLAQTTSEVSLSVLGLTNGLMASLCRLLERRIQTSQNTVQFIIQEWKGREFIRIANKLSVTLEEQQRATAQI